MSYSYEQWEARKQQWDEGWAIRNGGPSTKTLEELQELPAWLECHNGAVRPKTRQSTSVSGDMVLQDPLACSQWNGDQLARLADLYDKYGVEPSLEHVSLADSVLTYSQTRPPIWGEISTRSRYALVRMRS